MSRNRNRRPRPDGAPEPQDFKAPASPAEREAKGGDTVEVKFRGMTFEVAADPAKWSYWQVTQWLPSNNFANACIGLLGPGQTAKIHMRYPNLTSVGALDLFSELFMEIAKATGFGNAGNS